VDLVRVRVTLSTTAAVALVSGCSLLTNLSGLAGAEGDAGGSTDAQVVADAGAVDGESGDASSEADTGARCPGTGGPAGVPVGSFCIDATEVTNAQYLTYLIARKGETDGQPPQCAWNAGTGALQPMDPWPVPAGSEQLPVVGLDWCDARAFCAFYGKRLCGHIGGGPVDIADRAVATASQWYAACSHEADSLHTYSSGNVLTDGGCNFPPSTGPAAVRTRSCEGAYAGVFDLSGNVAEWEDACEPFDGGSGTDNRCLVRGGAWTYGDTCAAESGLDYPIRNYRNDDVGFRCCADL
jgi:formylglycine-generating enzyme required for sulfatase activity